MNHTNENSVIDNPLTSDSPVLECEEMYPEMTSEFKKILNEQYQLFCRKQLNYGPDNISLGTKCETHEQQKLSMTGIWFRMNDKINRLKQLLLLNKKDLVNESIQDSFSDLAVYSVISQIIGRGKWGK